MQCTIKEMYISNFYLVNGKLKIKCVPADDCPTDIKNDDDLRQIFGDEIINKINRRNKISKEEIHSAKRSAEPWVKQG